MSCRTEFSPTLIPRPSDRTYWNRFTGNEFGEEFEYNGGWQKSNKRSILRRALRQAIDPNDRVVDLMCGRYSYCYSSVGVDISEGMLRSNEDVDCKIVADLNTAGMPFSNRVFDAVVMVSGIGYLSNPEYAFAEVSRVLKPGGKFVIAYTCQSVARIVESWDILEPEKKLERLQEIFSSSGFGRQDVSELNLRYTWKEKGKNVQIFQGPLYFVVSTKQRRKPRRQQTTWSRS